MPVACPSRAQVKQGRTASSYEFKVLRINDWMVEQEYTPFCRVAEVSPKRYRVEVLADDGVPRVPSVEAVIEFFIGVTTGDVEKGGREYNEWIATHPDKNVLKEDDFEEFWFSKQINLERRDVKIFLTRTYTEHHLGFHNANPGKAPPKHFVTGAPKKEVTDQKGGTRKENLTLYSLKKRICETFWRL